MPLSLIPTPIRPPCLALTESGQDILQQKLEDDGAGACMPQSLLIGIDNTAREGKNQHYLTLMGYLAASAKFTWDCKHAESFVNEALALVSFSSDMCAMCVVKHIANAKSCLVPPEEDAHDVHAALQHHVNLARPFQFVL